MENTNNNIDVNAYIINKLSSEIALLKVENAKLEFQVLAYQQKFMELNSNEEKHKKEDNK